MMLNYTTKKKSDDDPRVGYSVLILSDIATGVQTEKAIQVSINGQPKWLAKSKIIDLGDGKYKVPNWMLVDNDKSGNKIPAKVQQNVSNRDRDRDEFEAVVKSLQQIYDVCGSMNETLVEVLHAIEVTNQHLSNFVFEMKFKDVDSEPSGDDESIIKAIEADIKESKQVGQKS